MAEKVNDAGATNEVPAGEVMETTGGWFNVYVFVTMPLGVKSLYARTLNVVVFCIKIPGGGGNTDELCVGSVPLVV